MERERRKACSTTCSKEGGIISDDVSTVPNRKEANSLSKSMMVLVLGNRFLAHSVARTLTVQIELLQLLIRRFSEYRQCPEERHGTGMMGLRLLTH